jgi:uncharacterized delta-60 repeat protein
MYRGWFFVVLAACAPVKGNPPASDAADPDAAGAGFQLAILTSSVAVPLDGSATIEVAITRTGGFTGEVSIAAITPPNGLQVTALTVPGDQATAEIVVGALSPLVIGDNLDFNLEGTATGVDARTAEITDAEVTGRPGSLDTDFGIGTGYASIGFGADDGGSFNSLDVLGGRIFATGIGFGGLGAARFSTMRFTDTGALDTTFNGGVLARTSFIGSSGEDTRSAAIGHQLDGRSILIGSNHSGPTGDVALARLSTGGSTAGDFDFGNQADAGEALLDLGGEENVSDGAVLPDNRIAVVGNSLGHHTVMLASQGGALDTSFGNGTGFFRDVLGNGSTASEVTIDNDGKIVVIGALQTATDIDLVLHRYTTTALDTSFGAGGRVILTAAGTDEGPINVVVLATSKLIVGGVSGANYQIRRINQDGTPDTTFGTNGIAEAPINGNAPRDMVVLPDGKILILAQSGNNAILTRFKSTGTIDPLFGTDGVVSVPFGDSAEVNAIVVYDSHKVVIAGGNVGGVPGPGTKGLIARVWM